MSLGLVEQNAIKALLDEAKAQAEQSTEALGDAARDIKAGLVVEGLEGLAQSAAATSVRMYLIERAVALLFEAIAAPTRKS